MTRYVSDVTQMIAANGVSVRMAAGVARPLPQALVHVALSRGVKAEASTEVAKAPENPSRVPEVVQAIHALMADGDEKAFSKTTGEPNLTALRKQAGFQVTDAERDEAWATVKAEV